ncbi:hematopoietic cell signal transducer isoform X2 [Ornithorhynchus anatinus]|uniref:hematopoietic cell signal transducer isoform X2 n=1 Tax=Ornithorhynchus anatinus TaxID=9258 RepID=UPI0010A76EA7|nr:hematopoietic cell signal transducer isoform X2 [Ornithorhynchus anatinus]
MAGTSLTGPALLLGLLAGATAQTLGGLCSFCSPLDLPLMIGLVLGDALVTVVIVVAVYFCTRRAGGSGGAAPLEDTKVYMNLPGRR